MFSLCNVCIFLFVFCLVFSNVNGSIRPNCADVLLRIYLPTHPQHENRRAAMFLDEDCADSRSDVDELRTRDCLYGESRLDK